MFPPKRRRRAIERKGGLVPFDGARQGSVQVGGRVAQPCSVVRTRDRVAGAALLAALAQISTPSAAHFLKSHQLLYQIPLIRTRGPIGAVRWT